MNKGFLFPLILIILGFLLVIISFLSLSPKISGAFLITIFFIPIAGSFGEYGNLLLILLIILTLALIILNFFLAKRKS